MQNNQPPVQPYDDDEIDLRQLVMTLWTQKALIMGVGVLGAALGVGASLLSTKYVTHGTFLTPSISAGTYKRYQSMLVSGPRLQQYLQVTGQANTPEGQLLLALAESPKSMSEAISPEFAFTDRDAKTFGVKVNNDDPGAMIGLRIQFSHQEPSGGQPVALLSEYARDTIIRVDMEANMLDQCTKLGTKEQELRNERIDNEFSISQEERRAANLREIIARNPEARTFDSRQIVSVEKGTERFLSPAAQLVAAEIQIADMKLDDIRRERERLASALKRDYYCQAQQSLQQATTGRTFISELEKIQAAVFEAQNGTSDIVEQTRNELDVERATWTNTYLQSMRFVAPPEGSEIKERKPGLALGLVLGGLLGGMLGVFGALVRAWWRGDGKTGV